MPHDKIKNNQQPITGNQPPVYDEGEINLLDLLEVLFKRWKLIAGSTVAAAIIAVIYSLLLPNIYTASTMIIPTDDDKGGMGMAALMGQMGGLAGLAGGAIGGKTSADLFTTLLKSEALEDPIIDRFKLMTKYKAKFRTDVYRALSGKTVVTSGKKDGVITISISDKDPRFAADLANALVEELGKVAVGLNVAGSGKNRVFLEKRIAETRADLNRAAESLKDFQSKNKTISVTEQTKATIEGVALLRGQLAIKEVELAAQQSRFTDASQEVKTTRSAISSLRAQIGTLEGQGAGSSSIPNIGSVPQLGQDYIRLMREFKIQEAVLEMLSKQYETAKISEAKDVTPFQVLQKARVPERKSKPKRSMIVILATVTVFFMSVFASFILEAYQKMPEADKLRLKAMVSRRPGQAEAV